jgi:hypothetical protein
MENIFLELTFHLRGAGLLLPDGLADCSQLLSWRPAEKLPPNNSLHPMKRRTGEAASLAGKIDLTGSAMWINIAIKSHIIEVRHENHSDDT